MSCRYESAISLKAKTHETPMNKGFGEGGAGEGNRTLTASLEGWSSTIELHPREKDVKVLNRHRESSLLYANARQNHLGVSLFRCLEKLDSRFPMFGKIKRGRAVRGGFRTAEISGAAVW